MIVQTINTSGCCPQTIVIGRRGTYDTMQIAFDLSYLVESYGNGVAVLAVKRSQDESAYPAVVTQEDNTLTWTVSETDTYYVGSGECQLMWYVDGGLAKTIIYPMVVMRDILQTAEEPPDGYENWIESLTALGAETQQNAQNAAQSASDASTAKDDAVTAKEAAEAAQQAAETAVTHYPKIENNYWMVWDVDSQNYVSTGIQAEGEDGYSPEISITTITGGHRVTITDKDHPQGQSFDVMDGQGGGGTSDYSELTNKPKINNVELNGNKTAHDLGLAAQSDIPTVPVQSVNGKTGAVVLSAADVGAKPDSYTAPVSSVNGKTGAVTLDAGDVEFDDTETYAAGSVGAELSSQLNAIGELNRQLSDVESTLLSETETKYIPKDATSEGTQLQKAGYIDLSGQFQLSASHSSSDFIEIQAILNINPYCYGIATILNIAFYDEDKQYITGSGIGASSSWGRVSGEVSIPENAKFFRLCLMNADSGGKISVKSVARYSTYEVEQAKAEMLAAISDVDAKVDAVDAKLSQTSKVMVADIVGYNGFIDATGIFNSSASWIVTGYILTKNLTTLTERVMAYTTAPYAVFYDKYKVFIGSATAQTAGLQNITVDIPPSAYYVRLNMFVADTTQYYEITVDEVQTAAIATQNKYDPLYGKKIGAVGDSITIGTHSVPGMTYVNQIANAHGMTVDNQAIWGSVFPTGKTQGGNPQGSIYSQIADLANDCDMVIISGGINDADYQADTSYWGEISGGYTATLDTTTFCGAFEGTLKAALDKFKGKPILFVFEHRITQKYQSQYGQHFEDVQYPLMIEMLNKWGIPYVDLFYDMPSIKLTPGYIDLYSFDNQGIHPNIAGYRKFYVPRVESGLEAIAK